MRSTFWPCCWGFGARSCWASAGRTSISIRRRVGIRAWRSSRHFSELRFVPPKTKRSRRVLPLPPMCVEALREHAERQNEARVVAGSTWREHGLIFPSRIGTPMEPDNLRRSWERIKKVAGVQLRLHDLRHTCVTLLLDLGVPPHIVREIAGHSALEVTMTIYAHASLHERYKALSRLGERLAKERLSSSCRQDGTEQTD
jgi:integrase